MNQRYLDAHDIVCPPAAEARSARKPDPAKEERPA